MKVLVWVVMVLLTLGGALAAEVETGYIHSYKFDNDLTDVNGTNDLTDAGGVAYSTEAMEGVASMDLDVGATEFAQATSKTWFSTGNNDHTICFWYYMQGPAGSAGTNYLASYGNTAGNNVYEAIHIPAKFSSTQITDIGHDTHGDAVYDTTNYDDDMWHHFCMVYTASNKTVDFYHNASYVMSGTHVNTPNFQGDDLIIGCTTQSCASTQTSNGLWDDWRGYDFKLTQAQIQNIFDNANGTVAGPAAPTVGVNREELVFQENDNNVSVNTPTYTEITSQSFETTGGSFDAYAGATINVHSPTFDSTSVCRVLINGVDYNSEATRSNTANTFGSISLLSTNTTLTAGNHTLSVECKRDGPRNFVATSTNAYLALNNLTTLHDSDTGLSVTPGYDQINTGTFTTGNSTNNATFPLVVVADYTATYDYTADGYISTILEFNGENCTALPRYGANGASGSVGGSCLFTVTNETAYTYRVYGSGSGNVDYLLNLKEMVLGSNEYNTTTLSGETFTTSELIKGMEVTPNNANEYLWVKAGVPVNGTADVQFYLNVTNTATQQSSITQRSISGQTGVAILAYVFGPDVVKAEKLDVELYGDCSSGTCTINGGDLTAYVGQLVSSTEQGFTVTLQKAYDLSSLSGFYVEYNGLNVTTTGNTLDVVTSNDTIAYTVGKSGYFTESYTGWNSTSDITVNLSQGVLINYSVLDLANNSIPGISWNITLAGRTYENVTNQTGIELQVGSNNLQITAPGYYTTNTTITHTLTQYNTEAITGLYDSQYTVGANTGGGGINNFTVQAVNTTFYDQVNYTAAGYSVFNLLQGYNYYFNFSSNLYANTNITLPANASTHTYNFSVLITNTFNVSFLDEITEAFIGENVSLQLISSVFAQNYTITDTTGTNISLLTPAPYTLRFSSASYTERDYIVNLTAGSYNNLELFMITLNESSQLQVIVEDTGGNRIEGATVSLLRYYVSCNCYKVVEMSATSANGEAVFWVQAVEGFYRWSVEYQGTVRFLSSSPENIVTDTRVFTINLGENYYETFEDLLGMASTITYNRVTGGLTFTWNDPSDSVIEGCVEAEYVNGTRWETLGPTCLTSANGVVVIVLDNTTRYKYLGYVETTQGNRHTLHSGWIENYSPVYDFGNLGMFLGIAVLIGLALLFSFSAIAVVVITVVGVVFISLLGITPFTTSFIMGLVALALGLSLYIMRR